MTCSCPKCHAQIEVDPSGIPENGTFTPCPECKGRIWMNKESYARMALRKEGKTYCDKCGNELAHSIVCVACGVMYPDYYLVQSSKPPRRQVEKPDLFSISFSLKPAAKQSYTYTGYTSTKKSGSGFSRTLFMKAGVTALAVLLVIGAGYYYKIKKSEQEFAINYMRALYTIKTGTDYSLNTCAKLSAEWKSHMDAGQNFAPHIKAEDESRLNDGKDSTDRFMQALKDTPKRFMDSKEKLTNLYEVFTKAHALAVSTPSSLSAFTDAVSKSQIDFNISLKELKQSLPSELSSELKIAKAKYKGLKDI